VVRRAEAAGASRRGAAVHAAELVAVGFAEGSELFFVAGDAVLGCGLGCQQLVLKDLEAALQAGDALRVCLAVCIASRYRLG
jgi:fructose-specific component phosphotransferase system IIB-like protein